MATPILMPKLGLTMTEGTVVNWDKQEGDAVSEGEVVGTISSEKLTYDVEAPASGTLLKIVVQEGDDAPVKATIGYIGAAGENVGGDSNDKTPGKDNDSDTAVAAEAQQEDAITPIQTHSASDGQRIFITPLAKKMAAKQNIAYDHVQGTGANGRITRRDIEKAAVEKPAASSPKADANPAIAPNTAGVYQGGVGLSGMRQAIARNMVRSLQTTAPVTLQRSVNIDALMAFRSEMKQKFATPLNDGQLSVTTLLVKAVILALEDTPEMNAWYQDGTYTQVQEVNIGMAVGLPDGLIVPVVKGAQAKTLTGLGNGLKMLAEKARDGQLKPDEYTGSTFTITNLGHEQIEYFTPIINPPEVGILGVGALKKQLVFDEDDTVVAQTLLPLSLTFDHQIVDGQQAAIFLDKIALNLKNPYELLL